MNDVVRVLTGLTLGLLAAAAAPGLAGDRDTLIELTDPPPGERIIRAGEPRAVTLRYREALDPETLIVHLNREHVSHGLQPAPGERETLELDLRMGWNTLEIRAWPRGGEHTVPIVHRFELLYVPIETGSSVRGPARPPEGTYFSDPSL